MLANLISRHLTKFRFSIELDDAYSLKYTVKDVTKLRGMSTNEPYIIIENKTIHLPKDRLLLDVLKKSPFKEADNQPAIKILDNDLNIFHPTVPMLAILRGSFYIKMFETLYFVANNEKFIKQSYNPEFIATNASPDLEPVVRSTLEQLSQIDSLSPKDLQTVFVKNIMHESLPIKIEKIRIKQLLKVIHGRIQGMQDKINTINQIAALKSTRRTKLITTFFLGQYALVHYLIYFHLSWDIMEPITVILANLDILIGYYFFVFRDREYTLEEIQKNLQEKRRYKYLKKHGFNLTKYEELLELKNYYEFRLDLFSKSPFMIMDRLENRIRYIDTR